MYIRKNHLTIGEGPEIYEIVSEDGRTVHWYSTEDELSELLDSEPWHCGDVVDRYIVRQPVEHWGVIGA